MRDQYAGDLSDLLKFSLLRALALADRTIGVAWYYNPRRDRLQDGRHREYWEEAKWASLDRDVWNALRDLSERSVTALEDLSIWPTDTVFHRVPIPAADEREQWAGQMTASMERAGLVFLDPDNGIGNAIEQHATLTEVASVRGGGRAVVVIKFPSRTRKHRHQIERYHDSLLTHARALSVTTLCTSVSVVVLNKHGRKQCVPRVRWFTLIDADTQLIGRVEQFAERLRRIEKCKADVFHVAGSVTAVPEKPASAVNAVQDALGNSKR